ncbi:acyl-CoA dehydrogenase family protein [Piscinibacter defluvii]|uniref:acyl-CoA dehydrogenase family protein n=1 Tax=Piscinibacter defluvii TaxID=1796922 RepID=UPI000FDDD3B0|nr:acyl-CoA dehydrogenase family protein [Piscinibacter defluvii]
MELSTEHRQVADMARRFADDLVRPEAERLDREEVFAGDIYRAMGENGLFGITVPEALGGAGLDCLAYSIVMEELSRGYASIADQCGLVELVTTLLVQHGSPAQQDRWIGPIVRAEKRAAYCITEAGAGSDVSGIKTTAVKQGSGWRLNGAKLWIHNAPVADVGFVLARTDPAAGKRGMSIFVVDCALPGVTRGPKEHKLGQRSSQVGELNFENVELGPEALLGTEGRGFHMMMSVLEKGRVGIASLAVGILQAALEASLEQARIRRQFGQAIAEFQAIQFMLADMAKDTEAARLLVRSAAGKIDARLDATAAASMAKCFAGDAAVLHTGNAIQIFGGSGYIRGYEVERLYRDAKITQIYEGTNQIQRVIIARKLLSA